jgi:hypothetical protein
MTLSRWIGAALLVAIVTTAGLAQPVQFKANVRMKDASDGSTSTGVMYFSGSKIRTELTKDGENMVILADPASRSQTILMAAEKMYMQMPLGEGPVNIPVTGPSDPTNPCSGGGNTDCVKGATESVNGYATVRWEYTSAQGVKTRAWVSTKLRYPIKTEDDDGGSMEFSNIAEGPQPASLFAIPAGFTKMDMGGMEMAGRGDAGRGRGRGNSMADVMSNLSPEMQAAMAAAMRGEGMPKGPMGPTGSAWEKGKGWVLSVSITGTRNKTNGYKDNMFLGEGTTKETYTVKFNASMPLNHGTPSIGVPGGPGPGWWLLQTENGSREAMATPITVSIHSEGRIDETWKGGCNETRATGGWVGAPPGWARTTIKADHEARVPIVPMSVDYTVQAYLKISTDLKTYDMLATLATRGTKEVRQRHSETQCPGGAVGKEDKSSDASGFGFELEMKNQPLPASVGPFSGSTRRTMKLLKNGFEDVDATITWTLTPIR